MDRSSVPAAFFPFLGPIIQKMEFSFIPTYVTDFFYASLQNIKANREASQNKVWIYVSVFVYY